MTSLLYSLAGFISLVISIGSVVFICYFTIKNGLKVVPVVGIFLILSVMSYLAVNPGEITNLGGFLVQAVQDISRGDA